MKQTLLLSGLLLLLQTGNLWAEIDTDDDSFSYYSTEQFAEAQQPPTPRVKTYSITDAYNQALFLEQQVKAMREAQQVTNIAKTPPVQTAKLPAHVYAKTLEVLEKIGRLQSQFGLPKTELEALSIQSISSEQVYESVVHLSGAMEEVLDNEMVDPPEDVKTVENKTASNAYEKMWEVSYLLDDLLGPINSVYIFTQLQDGMNDLNSIATKLSLDTHYSIPKLKPATATDSNIAGFRNMYKLAKLERTLDMNAVRVPSFPVGKITPSDTFDTSNNMMVELARIKAHLDISEKPPKRELPDQISPSQILQEMEKFGVLANALTAQLETQYAASN